jgi:DNA ligase-1
MSTLDGIHTMFKPMLATDADLSKLRFPLYASAKLDGVRAIVREGVVLSRSLKPIPSKHVQETFGHLEHLDGELIVGDPTSPTCYRDTVSMVMARDRGRFDVGYHVFDWVGRPESRWLNRQITALDSIAFETAPVRSHPQTLVLDMDMLLEVETEALEQGHEGLILRDPDAPYKFGRSTVREGFLLKLKRFVDAEAVVVGFDERLHNGNEATVDELGHTKRSSHQANKTGHGDLGALVTHYQGQECRIGTGFTAEDRLEIWQNQSSYVGKIAKFKFFPTGGKDKPRHPVFLGWRDPLDA